MLRLQLCVPPIFHSPPIHSTRTLKSLPCLAVSRKSDSEPDPKQAKQKPRRRKTSNEAEDTEKPFPTTIPRKPRRGRRSEAVAVEDYVRDSLDRTFASIKETNPELFEMNNEVVKERPNDDGDEDDDDEVSEGIGEKSAVVEEESSDWPLDADVGWGIRASEYFESHAIRNVVDDNGMEFDWEGEVDDNWVKEINCLEWESFAFHPSPLIVLVFERYNRTSDNWRALKELEKAVKVYWDAKDRLPPRSVKIDLNIEKDLAYALKVRECPQILFLRGNRLLYREKGIRTSEELVAMIAHFYYNAKRPSWIDVKELSRP